MSKKIKQTWDKAKGMSMPKKVASFLWLITGALLFASIGTFVNERENHGGDITKYSANYDQKFKVEELLPHGVIEGNRLSEEDYFVQATGWEDLNGDGMYDKHDDIVPGVFYPLKTVRRVPRQGRDCIFDFKHFHRKGYGWAMVHVRTDVTVNGQKYGAGGEIDLKDVYDAAEYQPEKKIADDKSASYLEHFYINDLNWKKTSIIAEGQPFYQYKGEMAFDIQRESDGVTPKFRPSEDALESIHKIAAMGLTFVASMTSAIFVTVAASIYDKKRNGAAK